MLPYFRLYWQVAEFRPDSLSGIMRISPATIRDWCEFFCVQLHSGERALLMELDKAYVSKIRSISASLKVERAEETNKKREYKTHGHREPRL